MPLIISEWPHRMEGNIAHILVVGNILLDVTLIYLVIYLVGHPNHGDDRG